jgi:hypothetical protein
MAQLFGGSEAACASGGGGKSTNDASFLSYRNLDSTISKGGAGGREVNTDSPNVVPVKVVFHRGDARHVNDWDGAAESDKGKGVAQWGEE